MVLLLTMSMITTNLNLEELEEKVGSHTMDRLIGNCRIVENCASSYRQERAEKLGSICAFSLTIGLFFLVSLILYF